MGERRVQIHQTINHAMHSTILVVELHKTELKQQQQQKLHDSSLSEKLPDYISIKQRLIITSIENTLKKRL